MSHCGSTLLVRFQQDKKDRSWRPFSIPSGEAFLRTSAGRNLNIARDNTISLHAPGDSTHKLCDITYDSGA